MTLLPGLLRCGRIIAEDGSAWKLYGSGPQVFFSSVLPDHVRIARPWLI